MSKLRFPPPTARPSQKSATALRRSRAEPYSVEKGLPKNFRTEMQGAIHSFRNRKTVFLTYLKIVNYCFLSRSFA